MFTDILTINIHHSCGKNIRFIPLRVWGCKHEAVWLWIPRLFRPLARCARRNEYFRWMSSDRLEETQNKNVWICKTIWHGLMMFDVWWHLVLYTYHIPWEYGINWSMDAGDPISRKHWTTNNDVTCLEHKNYLPGRFFPDWEIGW